MARPGKASSRGNDSEVERTFTRCDMQRADSNQDFFRIESGGTAMVPSTVVEGCRITRPASLMVVPFFHFADRATPTRLSGTRE